jgi:hypothetical protein
MGGSCLGRRFRDEDEDPARLARELVDLSDLVDEFGE